MYEIFGVISPVLIYYILDAIYKDTRKFTEKVPIVVCIQGKQVDFVNFLPAAFSFFTACF